MRWTLLFFALAAAILIGGSYLLRNTDSKPTLTVVKDKKKIEPAPQDSKIPTTETKSPRKLTRAELASDPRLATKFPEPQFPLKLPESPAVKVTDWQDLTEDIAKPSSRTAVTQGSWVLEPLLRVTAPNTSLTIAKDGSLLALLDMDDDNDRVNLTLIDVAKKKMRRFSFDAIPDSWPRGKSSLWVVDVDARSIIMENLDYDIVLDVQMGKIAITRFGQHITRGEMAEMIFRLIQLGEHPRERFPLQSPKGTNILSRSYPFNTARDLLDPITTTFTLKRGEKQLWRESVTGNIMGIGFLDDESLIIGFEDRGNFQSTAWLHLIDVDGVPVFKERFPDDTIQGIRYGRVAHVITEGGNAWLLWRLSKKK